ncbi:MAG: hypothetical protein P8163_18225 [Candidatus Thiodiazotropha sp.]
MRKGPLPIDQRCLDIIVRVNNFIAWGSIPDFKIEHIPGES